MTQTEYQDAMNSAYNDIKKVDKASGEDSDEEDGHESALRICFDWYEQQERHGSKRGYRSTRSISARMKAAQNELTTLVSALRVSYDHMQTNRA